MAKRPLHILQFAFVINKNDFIDNIVSRADRSIYKMSVCTLVREGNIKSVDYDEKEVIHAVLGTKLNKTDFIKTIVRLVRVIRKLEIDVVHAHHFYEGLIAMAASFLTGRRKLIIGRHYHNELYLTTKGVKLKLYLWLEALVNSYATTIIAPSSDIVTLLLKQGVSSHKIRHVPYGFNFTDPKYMPPTDEARQMERRKIELSPTTFAIGNFARHHAIKGQVPLLKAFKALQSTTPRAVLIMVGDGPIHGELVSMSQTLGLEGKVRFLGWQREISSIVSAMDVVIHPSLQEAFPQIMIETMALARPLLITPVSGATDIVRDGQNAYLIPFDSPEIWREKLEAILQDPETAGSVGQSARKDVLENLDIGKVIHQFEDVYASLEIH